MDGINHEPAQEDELMEYADVLDRLDVPSSPLEFADDTLLPCQDELSGMPWD
ncbi:hypothetical protein KI809_04360 [Geobacter pelophilus]|uniref:Uncharacterized protein n=1 Tax=Geoanaerobacter pelophilus TaxID=60036 RepID=A0AAW4KXS1_9BACT|nr:hypothetical protein [Geoanaerobacter pelophilus]